MASHLRLPAPGRRAGAPGGALGLRRPAGGRQPEPQRGRLGRARAGGRGDEPHRARPGRDEPGHPASGGDRLGGRDAARRDRRTRGARASAAGTRRSPRSGASPCPPTTSSTRSPSCRATSGARTSRSTSGGSRIDWIAALDAPKVPVVVAATGPHVIEAGARHAEQIDFTVGAEPERLRWAAGVARAAAGGRDVSLGRLRQRGGASRLARRHASWCAAAPRSSRASRPRAPRTTGSPTSRAPASSGCGTIRGRPPRAGRRPDARDLEDEFIDRFAIVGSAPRSASASRSSRRWGSSAWWWCPGRSTRTRAQLAASDERFAADVLPALAGLG